MMHHPTKIENIIKSMNSAFARAATNEFWAISKKPKEFSFYLLCYIVH